MREICTGKHPFRVADARQKIREKDKLSMATRKKNTAASKQAKKTTAKGRAAPAKSKTESAQASAPAPVQPNALDGSVSHLIHRAEQCSTDLFGSVAANGQLTPRQFAILDTIKDNPGISQTGLVTLTGIDRSTLADIVRRLLERDLVQRERTEKDARAYSVKLTRKGIGTLKKMQPHAESVDKEILAALPKEHRGLFVKLLSQMVESLSDRAANKPE
jgi:DNA-binding MarR family transcriptional regulator